MISQSEVRITDVIHPGCPYPRNDTSVQVRGVAGRGGLVLLQDTQLIENLAHFSRESILER